jgi:hypothetical protein
LSLWKTTRAQHAAYQDRARGPADGSEQRRHSGVAILDCAENFVLEKLRGTKKAPAVADAL